LFTAFEVEQDKMIRDKSAQDSEIETFHAELKKFKSQVESYKSQLKAAKLQKKAAEKTKDFQRESQMPPDRYSHFLFRLPFGACSVCQSRFRPLQHRLGLPSSRS